MCKYKYGNKTMIFKKTLLTVRTINGATTIYHTFNSQSIFDIKYKNFHFFSLNDLEEIFYYI